MKNFIILILMIILMFIGFYYNPIHKKIKKIDSIERIIEKPKKIQKKIFEKEFIYFDELKIGDEFTYIGNKFKKTSNQYIKWWMMAGGQQIPTNAINAFNLENKSYMHFDKSALVEIKKEKTIEIEL